MQAMLGRPEVLVLDEPTAGLDPQERIRFRNLIARFSEKRTILLATHIVSDVEFISNEVLIMKERQAAQKRHHRKFRKRDDRESVEYYT